MADLRERRVEILRGNLREALVAGGHDRLRGVVEPLSEEFDLVDIALAAISLVEGAGARDEDEIELAPAAFQQPGPPPRRPSGPGPRGPVSQGRGPIGPRPGGRPPRPGGRQDDSSVPGGEWVQLFIGGGRKAGIRPGDLVGAITNEAGVPGSVVGAIQISDDFALVDVRAPVAESVAHALRGATIRGRRLPVRRERG